jgi:hypothetical protein
MKLLENDGNSELCPMLLHINGKFTMGTMKHNQPLPYGTLIDGLY